jgi:hypothetical protein
MVKVMTHLIIKSLHVVLLNILTVTLGMVNNFDKTVEVNKATCLMMMTQCNETVDVAMLWVSSRA